jgi:hypothetical protein
MHALPGGELIDKGIADLARNEETVESLLVSIGSPKLRSLGISLGTVFDDAEHRLYALLGREHGNDAHGQYNALIRLLVSRERAWARATVDTPRLRSFLKELSRAAKTPTRVYLTGGASQLLRGLRDSTVGIDLTFEPESDELFRSMAGLKETLNVNVEIVSPAHFVPALPGWRDRCESAMQIGKLTVLHFDPYTQALSKLERGHARDLEDVQALVRQKIVDPARLRGLFEDIRSELFRYPAVDPKSLSARVDRLETGIHGNTSR